MLKQEFKLRQAVLLIPNELPMPINPRDGEVFSLKELQEIVGGNIEVIRPLRRWKGKNDLMIVNEDGKRLNLIPNAMATLVYGYSGDVIVGNALIIHVTQID